MCRYLNEDSLICINIYYYYIIIMKHESARFNIIVSFVKNDIIPFKMKS